MKTKLTESAFLAEHVGVKVDVYLINGIRLSGTLLGAHQDLVFLEPLEKHDGTMQMVLKHAISSIVPKRLQRAHRRYQ